MPVTWRTELYFECDKCFTANLALDQVSARTKRGMFKIAQKLGWEWEKDGTCLCPKCSKDA